MKLRYVALTWLLLAVLIVSVWGFAIKGFFHKCPPDKIRSIGETQIQLRDAGYYHGRIDYIWGDITYEHAKPYLKEGVTSEEWTPLELTKENLLKQMEDYMEFAWDKANNCRGISASRSISHYKAWIWLVGDTELLEKVDDDSNYEHYGKEVLAMICNFYKWDSKQWDDKIRVNSESELDSAYATREASESEPVAGEQND